MMRQTGVSRASFAKALAPCGIAVAVSAGIAPAQPASLSLTNRAYVVIPNSPDFAMQQFTLATWLKPTGPGENGGGTLVAKSDRPATGSLLCSWWLGWTASTGQIQGLVVHEFGVSGTSITSTAAIPIGAEGHAALTFDGTTLRLYVNGVLNQEKPYGFTGVYYSTEDVLIGAFRRTAFSTFNRFQGSLDDVTIWNRALDAGEIAALVACEPVGAASGLVAHLPFTDTQLADTSGNSHGGVAGGAIVFGPQAALLGAPPYIAGQPASQSVCVVAADIVVDAVGLGAFTYQWQVARSSAGPFVNLIEGNNTGPGGAVAFEATRTTLSNLRIVGTPTFLENWQSDAAYFRCVVIGSCGTTTTQTAAMTVRQCPYGVCPADYDASGGTPDSTDIGVFFTDWLTGQDCADVDCSGGTPDSTDIDAFFSLWLAGGC